MSRAARAPAPERRHGGDVRHMQLVDDRLRQLVRDHRRHRDGSHVGAEAHKHHHQAAFNGRRFKFRYNDSGSSRSHGVTLTAHIPPAAGHVIARFYARIVRSVCALNCTLFTESIQSVRNGNFFAVLRERLA